MRFFFQSYSFTFNYFKTSCTQIASFIHYLAKEPFPNILIPFAILSDVSWQVCSHILYTDPQITILTNFATKIGMRRSWRYWFRSIKSLVTQWLFGQVNYHMVHKGGNSNLNMMLHWCCDYSIPRKWQSICVYPHDV